MNSVNIIFDLCLPFRTKQHILEVLLNGLNEVILAVDSVDEILKFDHSNENL